MWIIRDLQSSAALQLCKKTLKFIFFANLTAQQVENIITKNEKI